MKLLNWVKTMAHPIARPIAGVLHKVDDAIRRVFLWLGAGRGR